MRIAYFLAFLITQVFHEIEHILLEKCYNTSRPSCHEIQKLFQQEPSEAYELFGKDLLSSISLVNRYPGY